MPKFVALLRASHFQPTLAVTAIATALALSAGRGTGAVWVLLAVASGQFSVGWSNDYLDRERDARAQRSDKPIVARQVNADVVGVCAIAALIICIPLSMFSGWRAGTIHLIAVGLAWLYNIWLKSTIFSAVPYALAFGLLPVFVALGLEGHPLPRLWAIIAASLLGIGAHFINTLPDLEVDRANGVFGMPHRFGSTATLVLGALLIATSTIVIAMATIEPPNRGRIALVLLAIGGAVAVCVAGFAGRNRAAWTLTIFLACVSVSAFIANGGAFVHA